MGLCRRVSVYPTEHILVQKDGKFTRNSCMRRTPQCLHEALPLKITGKIIPRTSKVLSRVVKSLSKQRSGKRYGLGGDRQWLLACEQTSCGYYTDVHY
jgi:hypothetical protein